MHKVPFTLISKREKVRRRREIKKLKMNKIPMKGGALIGELNCVDINDKRVYF